VERWFDSIFNPELVQWGLRGDPYLWREMREHLKDRPLPPAADAFLETLGELFRNLTAACLAEWLIQRYGAIGISRCLRSAPDSLRDPLTLIF
jgi:site-specific recombinase